MNKSEAVAAIALTIPYQATSGDILRALSLAWQSGHIEGHYDGFMAATKAHSAAMDAVFTALQPPKVPA